MARSEMARTQVDLGWLDVKKEIADIYNQLIFLGARKLLLQDQDSILSIAQSKIQIRKELAAATRLESVLIETERKNVQDLIQRTEREGTAEKERLKSLPGVSDSIIISASSFVRFPLPTIDTALFSKHPYVLRERTFNGTIEAELKLMKANSLPDFTIGYVNQSLTGAHSLDGIENRIYTVSDRFQSVQFAMGIPLFYGSVKRKEKVYHHQIQQSELRESYLLEQLRQNYLSDASRYEGAFQSLNMYEKQMQPQIDAMLEESEALLQTGEISVYEFMWTRRQAIDLQLNRLNAIFELNRLINQLNWYKIE
jgi:cobalt-zinc-cadmium resistance protein CzcA